MAPCVTTLYSGKVGVVNSGENKASMNHLPRIIPFLDFRQTVLGTQLAFLRSEQLDHPERDRSELLALVMAFGEDQLAFDLGVNSSATGVRTTEWHPEPVDLGEYGSIITNSSPATGLEGARFSDVVEQENDFEDSVRLGYEGSLTLLLDNGGKVLVTVSGDDLFLSTEVPS